MYVVKPEAPFALPRGAKGLRAYCCPNSPPMFATMVIEDKVAGVQARSRAAMLEPATLLTSACLCKPDVLLLHAGEATTQPRKLPPLVRDAA